MISEEPADWRTSEILATPNESRSIEFKDSFPWPETTDDLKNNQAAQQVIATILAMSNLQDGGRIILGVSLDPISRLHVSEGMKKEHLVTYDHELIYTQARNFGNPEPRFETKLMVFSSKQFIVFRVSPTIVVPMLCRIPGRDTKAYGHLENGGFYIRTDKPETRHAQTPAEIREVMDIAIYREVQRQLKPIVDLFGTSRGQQRRSNVSGFDSEISDIKRIT